MINFNTVQNPPVRSLWQQLRGTVADCEAGAKRMEKMEMGRQSLDRQSVNHYNKVSDHKWKSWRGGALGIPGDVHLETRWSNMQGAPGL